MEEKPDICGIIYIYEREKESEREIERSLVAGSRDKTLLVRSSLCIDVYIACIKVIILHRIYSNNTFVSKKENNKRSIFEMNTLGLIRSTCLPFLCRHTVGPDLCMK